MNIFILYNIFFITTAVPLWRRILRSCFVCSASSFDKTVLEWIVCEGGIDWEDHTNNFDSPVCTKPKMKFRANKFGIPVASANVLPGIEELADESEEI